MDGFTFLAIVFGCFYGVKAISRLLLHRENLKRIEAQGLHKQLQAAQSDNADLRLKLDDKQLSDDIETQARVLQFPDPTKPAS